MLLWGARARDAAHRVPQLTAERRLALDGAVVPGLLLLVARDLALYDPPRILAWRLSHDARVQAAAAWLGPLLPSPSGALDRDPIALALAALATLMALGYAILAASGAALRVRATLIAVATLALVVGPSAGFVLMGAATERPYGQDGGVVQLPLAIDRILAGESPYAADYSGTVLARQAHVSSFWDERGGNPILRHHAYLPGTHLVMLPLHLASRAAFGFFDPRTATLAFYAVVVVLASLLPRGGEARLAAAALAALNPLVYWHQIFGANDLVFVAMLLAAVLAARAERRLAAGALVGLACATKQLAWPFAPFLLVALSGARSFLDLGTRTVWRRLAPAVAVAGTVFLLVVLPVAALDFRAFWADIVVYNVGLPGGDNYPIGGTPGIGFANYLIYFGQVADLRQYFPFGIFYALLVPLGLLLLRAQLSDGRPEWALATGSAGLLASLYFSRVVHPNYLIPAAVCLPLAVLARRRGADVALVPLLLFALAVEVAENGVFRAAWEQAAAGLVERASGLAAALAPRAHPGLTTDPIGLLVSATAAGLGLGYLLLATTNVYRRVRLALSLGAFVLAVLLPTLFLASVSRHTGIVRAQHPAVVQAAADASRLTAGRSPYSPPPETFPRGREAVSSSFRLDPPAELLPSEPFLPPGPGVLAAAARLAGLRDLRLVTIPALLLLAGALALRLEGRRRRAAVGLALLAAPFSLGTVLGAPFVLSAVALLGAWFVRGRGVTPGVLAGVAVALDHRAILVAPLLTLGSSAWPPADRWWSAAAAPRARIAAAAACLADWTRSLAADRGGPGRLLGAALGAYGLLVVPVLLLDPSAFVARLGWVGRPGPGLGLVNLLAYLGLEEAWSALAPVVLLAGFAALAWLLTRAWPPLARAGVGSLIGIVLARSLSAEAVALPILLLALAAVVPGDEDAALSAVA